VTTRFIVISMLITNFMLIISISSRKLIQE